MVCKSSEYLTYHLHTAGVYTCFLDSRSFILASQLLQQANLYPCGKVLLHAVTSRSNFRNESLLNVQTERFAPLRVLLWASPRQGPGKYDFIRSLLKSISQSQGKEKDHKWDLVGELFRSGRQAAALQPETGMLHTFNPLFLVNRPAFDKNCLKNRAARKMSQEPYEAYCCRQHKACLLF